MVGLPIGWLGDSNVIDQIRNVNDALTVAMFFSLAGYCWTMGCLAAGMMMERIGRKTP